MGLVAGTVLGNLDVVFKTIGDYYTRKLINCSGRVLFSACSNGTLKVLKFAFNMFKVFNDVDQRHFDATSMDSFGETGRKLIEKELMASHDLLSSGDATLLLVLCSSRAEPSAAQLLFDFGFPNCLLLNTYCGKNALQFAIWYHEVDMIKVILCNEQRRKLLLDPCLRVFQGLSAVEYARSLQYTDVVEYLEQRSH